MNNKQLQEQFIEYCVDSKHGLIKPHKMSQARLIAKWSSQEIYEVLMELQLMNLEGINNVLSAITGVPVKDPMTESFHMQFPRKTLSLVSHKAAVEYRIFPIRIEQGKLQLAMANPTDATVLKAVNKMSGLPIEPFVCYSKNILRAVVRFYNFITDKSFESLIRDAMDEIKGKKRVAPPPPNIWTEPLSQALRREIRLFPTQAGLLEEGEVSVSLLVQKIINNAVYLGASDIHFEPFEDAVTVRFRKDGMLFAQWFIPNDLNSYVFNRIKVMAGLDVTSTRRPQDGYIAYENVLPVGVDIRVSVVPSVNGERIVLRLLDKSRGLFNPELLGLEEDHLVLFQKKIRSPQGMILMTGPTGSGKTTTIYAALDQLNTEHRCIITIEDPTEYELKGINQVQVEPRFEMGFTQSLRAILRQNPDVIVLGEVRDSESAIVAVNASSTGHMVFSTLHTNDASQAIPRLISMGCDPYVLSDSLQLIVAQRLVRRLCPGCKRIDEIDDRRIKELGLSDIEVGTHTYYAPVGCQECNQLGYLGRVGVFELLVIDDTIRDMIVSHAHGLQIHKYAVSVGMRTMHQDALIKARDGITSLDEVQRVTPR